MPTTKLLRRGKLEERKDEKDKLERLGITFGGLDLRKERDKDQSALYKKYEDLLYIHTR
jgi:hypothetical protein